MRGCLPVLWFAIQHTQRASGYRHHTGQ